LRRESGFTLLELLVALSIFALIAVVSYGAVAPAGEGFEWLRGVRGRLHASHVEQLRIRQDVNALGVSADAGINPLIIRHDNRGGEAFDEVWMLVRPMASPSMMMVHYYMDEEDQVLVRETASPWARTGVEPVVWRMGHILSFEVEALDEEGKWQDVWDAGESRKLPLALRVRLKGDQGEREFLLPVFTQAGV